MKVSLDSPTQTQFPVISPRYGWGQTKESLLKNVQSETTTVSSSGTTSVKVPISHRGNNANVLESVLPLISAATPSDAQFRTAVKGSNSTSNSRDIFEEVDTFHLDELVERKSSRAASICSSVGSSTPNSSRQSPFKPSTAKADRMGYLTECTENFLKICGLGDDYKSHSLISLVKFSNPEKLQQQAYMLDSLASSGEAGKGVLWVAELNNTYMDVSYEVHVTLSPGSPDRLSGYELDVDLKSVATSARNSFLNSQAASMMCRQATNIVGNMKDPGLRILVVDDSMLVLKVVSRLIQGEGHIVDCKKDGLEALEALKNNLYDAVIMDIHMPEMNGLEASFEFRSHEGLMLQYRSGAQSTKLKIIAMSADFSDSLIADVMKAGFDGFLAKPLTLAGFRDLKLRPSLLRNASCRNNVM
jgi:CheY-like chemotaxis protein